MIYVPQNMT